jgi:hypothetical protein
MHLLIDFITFQVTMYNFLAIKDAADVAIDTMLSGIQVELDANYVHAFNALWIIHSLSSGVRSYWMRSK